MRSTRTSLRVFFPCRKSHRAIVDRMFSSYSGQIAAWLPFVNIDGNTATLVDNIAVDQVFTHFGITVTVIPWTRP
jgi:hypothetical protein